MERRVVLLSRDAGLASTVGRLLSNGDHIAHFRSAAELVDWSNPEVAAVVLDGQPNARRLSYKQVRERYDGPLVMLLDKGERQPDLPPDGARRFLHRPFTLAELSSLLAAPIPELGLLEAAIIAAWSRHAIAEPVPRPPRDPSYRVGGRRPSLRRRARVWAATVVALMSLLLVFSLGDRRGSCASGCTTFGGAVAGAAENATPAVPSPGAGSAGGGSDGGQPPGSSAASSEPPTPTGGTGFPVVIGIGGLIESINPITSDDTTPPSGPEAVPGVPAPPGVTQPPGTTPPGTSPPPTTAPPTTASPTTEPPTTEPATTEPATTEPATTEPATTEPATTEPATTEPPTTEPATTEPPTTEPATTEPPTTEPATTAETTAAPTTT